MGFLSSFKRLKTGLTKTSSALAESITSALGISGNKIDPEFLDSLEEALLKADVGLEATDTLLAALQKTKFAPDATQADIQIALQTLIAGQLAPLEGGLHLAQKPHVILMVGVNGSGKTTTTAKLAELLQSQKLKVQLAAADTFRAGAVAQLQTWAQRTNTPITTPDKPQTDPAALAYQATTAALENNADVLIIDTAGRLSNKTDLMDELAKIRRTILKQLPPENLTTLLVLDGTVGQNALSQLSAFAAATPLDGLIITKLDSTAKGGILLAITATTNPPPVLFITTGETTADMHPFNAADYAAALLNGEHTEKH